jgi:hypothetical protein
MNRLIPLRRLAAVLVAAIISAASVARTAGTASASTSWSPFSYVAPFGFSDPPCLDNATENANTVQLWHCSGGPEQKWAQGLNSGPVWVDPIHVPGVLVQRVSQIKNLNTNRCLKARLSISSGPWGTPVPSVYTDRCSALTDTSALMDKWTITDNGLGSNIHNDFDYGLCLTRMGGTNDGVRVGLAPCDVNSAAQKWARAGALFFNG